MKKRKVMVFAFLSLLIVGGVLTGAGEGVKKKYLPSDKEFYVSPADIAFLRPGLNIDIQSVAVSGSTVTATFRLSDNDGQPLDRTGIETPGTVSTSWILARIKPGDTQYSAYRTNAAGQPSTDAGGTYASLGDGVYTYTFGTQLPSDVAAGATHTVGVYGNRDLRAIAEDLGLTRLAETGRYIDNDTHNFLPAGGEVTVVRDVVRTETCNQCHDPLALHGGQRQETELCILCHQPQNIDPDTGNTVDFKVMIHKIHRGADLPSVQAGTPYQIIGFRDSVHDYSEVEWPQDVRNCTTCHQGGTQSDNWKTNPSRVACGSCHDNVNFATGEHHAGGVQVDDSKCSICHAADTGLEFDLSVAGVHTIPVFSKQLPGLNLEILGITNTNPGNKPTVSFTLKDNKGNPVDLATLNRMRLTLAGPTSDYTFRAQENVASAQAGPTSFTYTFSAAIPADATGTFAMGAEARRNVTLPGPLLGQSFTATESAFNPIKYFAVGGGAVVPRRQVVDLQKCDSCHKTLGTHFHGLARKNTEYCPLCHNPKFTDASQRPADQLPGETLNFRTMIHRIHTGEELSNEYTTYDVGTPATWNEVLFPGDRRNCAKCHVNDSHELPLPTGLANADNPRGFFTPLGPAASACLGCHDSQDAAAHAFLQTAPFGESCAACHGEGKEFAVSRVHAR